MLNCKHILAIINPEQEQQICLSRALEIAGKTQARITALLSIYDFSYEMTTMLSVDERETMRRAVVADREEWLKQVIAHLPNPNAIEIDSKVIWHNKTHDAALQEIAEQGQQLIVKGTRQHGTLKSVIFTPTDWHLLRKAPVPVLLVKEHDWPEHGQVIAAVNAGAEDQDHQILNDKVTQQAKAVAQLFEGNVHLVNSYPGAPVNIALEIPEFDSQGYSESVKKHHLQAMQKLADTHAITEQHCHVIEGLPEDVIPEIAEKIDAGLVVIGTVGRQGLSAALIGNTAEHVIDRLNCDVLAIKPDAS